MYIPNDATQKVVVETFELNESKGIKVPKVVKPTIKKSYYKTLGTSVIITFLARLRNRLMSAGLEPV